MKNRLKGCKSSIYGLSLERREAFLPRQAQARYVPKEALSPKNLIRWSSTQGEIIFRWNVAFRRNFIQFFFSLGANLKPGLRFLFHFQIIRMWQIFWIRRKVGKNLVLWNRRLNNFNFLDCEGRTDLMQLVWNAIRKRFWAHYRAKYKVELNASVSQTLYYKEP